MKIHTAQGLPEVPDFNPTRRIWKNFGAWSQAVTVSLWRFSHKASSCDCSGNQHLSEWCLLITLRFFRHWKELMEKTGVFFEMTETFTLDNMFAMELHKHTEVLNEIVTAAVKEVAIEKVGKENL